MPVDRDTGRTGPERLPAVVTDATGDVGFLDVAGHDAVALADAVDDALGTLTVGAVLSVYSVRATELDVQELCERGGLELISAIRHSAAGTTYTIRRRPTESQERLHGP